MLHPNLEAVLQTVNGLSKMLGRRYEVILHDLSHMESSIVAIEGDVTQRKIGGPATNYLIHLLKKYGDEAPDSINYRSVLPDGRILRSSTMFIRDDEHHIIGSLCVNQDLTDYIVASKMMQDLCAFHENTSEDSEPQEMFLHDINEVVESMVRSELETVQKPVAYMQKEDKLEVVESLENKGIFDVKGAVEYVAERLGVTNFTVYNYLKEVRSLKR
ncbi:MAG TPA: aminotransferase [Lachnospiraceae bacterium]|nr:aminotransferase [Lachnospiraceae bacterium]